MMLILYFTSLILDVAAQYGAYFTLVYAWTRSDPGLKSYFGWIHMSCSSTYCHVDRDASLSEHILLLHQYESDFAYISDLYSLVIGLYKYEIWEKKLKYGGLVMKPRNLHIFET